MVTHTHTVENMETNNNSDYSRELQPLVYDDAVTTPNYESSFSTKEKSQDDKTTDDTNKLTNFQGLMHFLKGYITVGYLTLPYAVKKAGLWAGGAGLFFVSGVTLCSVLALVESSQLLCKKLGQEKLNYPESMRASFQVGPMCLRSHARKGKILVMIVLFLLSFGSGTIELSLLAAYTKQLIDITDIPDINIRAYLALWTVLLIPIFSITKLKILAPLSLLANLCSVFVIVIVFQYLLTDLPNPSTRTPMTSPTGVFVFVGSALYAFEGIGLVLSVENIMRKPQDYYAIAAIGTLIVIALHTSSAMFGYLHFGDTTKGSIILNLPTDTWLYRSVKILSLVNLYISVPVDIYVSTRLIWEPWQETMTSGTKLHNNGEHLVKYALLLCLCIVTLAVPNVELLVSLVGSFCGSILAFVFPLVMQLLIALSPEFKHENGHNKRLCMSIITTLLLIIGCVCVCAAVSVSLWELVDQLVFDTSIEV